MNQILSQSPMDVMAKNGKSFYFASFFFNRAQMERISLLYQICRYVDDSADEVARPEAIENLKRIRRDLENPQIPSDFQSAIQRLENFGISRKNLLELVQGAEFDVSGAQMQTQKDFLQYCYWVAGVVGLMMCPLLGTQENKAYPFAIQLGIAMQTTNICRDILEDAENNRIYIPLEVRDRMNIKIDQLKRGVTPLQLKVVVKEYLEFADQTYESAYQGLAYLPFRSRLCIVLAGEIYRAIGHKIRSQDYEVLSGRAYLSFAAKFFILIKCLRFFFAPCFWIPRKNSPSQPQLSWEIQDGL